MDSIDPFEKDFGNLLSRCERQAGLALILLKTRLHLQVLLGSQTVLRTFENLPEGNLRTSCVFAACCADTMKLPRHYANVHGVSAATAAHVAVLGRKYLTLVSRGEDSVLSHEEYEGLTESVWFDEEESEELIKLLSNTTEVYQKERARMLSLIKALGAFSILGKCAGDPALPTIAADNVAIASAERA